MSDITTVNKPRGVERVIAGQAVMDGAGVKINRVLTQQLQQIGHRQQPRQLAGIQGDGKPGLGLQDHLHHPEGIDPQVFDEPAGGLDPGGVNAGDGPQQLAEGHECLGFRHGSGRG